MTFLAPGWIALSAFASLAVAAIHLIAWRLPRTVTLPTARFVPDEPVRRAARTVRPSDLVLLALRVTVLMLGGLALARPSFITAPQGRATVVAVERSRATGDMVALRDSVRAVVPGGERVSYVVFDTTARTYADEQSAFEAAAAAGAPAEAALTVGFVAATREARRLQQEYERIRIVFAARFTRGTFDAATVAVRNTWNDSIRLVRVLPSLPPPLVGKVVTSASVNDPVIAGVRLAESNGLIHGLSRIERESVGQSPGPTPTLTSILWLRADSGSLERVDGIHTGGFTAIGHFIQTKSSDSGRVIARWVNGAPAAWEVMSDEGCMRTIGFDVLDKGDFTLTPSFQRLAAELLRPCVDERSETAPDSLVAALAPPPGNRTTIAVPDESGGSNRLAAMLMIAALVLSFVELWARRKTVALSPGELA